LAGSGLRYDAAVSLTEGDPVEIIRGPLTGVRGTLIRRERSHFVIIGVRLIQQGATVKIDVEDVRRIGAPFIEVRNADDPRLTEPKYAVAAR
jgi:ribosomal protein L24